MSNTIGNFINKVKDQVFGGHEKTEENGSGINIKDTFDKTDGEGPSLGKLTTAAGVGTVLGISLANKSEINENKKEINELKERVEKLEGALPKDMGRQLSSLVNGEKPAASTAEEAQSPQVKETPAEKVSTKEKPAESQNSSDFTTTYAKETLARLDNYMSETQNSLLKSALEGIRDGKSSTLVEKDIAKYGLEISDNSTTWLENIFQEGYVKDENDYKQRSMKIMAVEFLSEPKNLEGSFGKVIMKLNREMTEQIHRYHDMPENDFRLSLESIAQSPFSTPYEKTMSNFHLKQGSHYSPVGFKRGFTKSLLNATEKSRPISDIAYLAQMNDRERGYFSKLSDNVFKFVIDSPEATDREKTLAKEGLQVGKEFKMTQRDRDDDKERILGKIYQAGSIE